MMRERNWTFAVRTFALAALAGWGAFGCGDDDGPTGPEPASLPELFGDQLYRADGSLVGVGILDNIPLIGIYFTSPGCPACEGFTPALVDAYNQLREEGRSFEVVLVTQSMSDPSLFDYMADSGMEWLAVSSQGARASALVQRYNILWVPTLVVIDGAGNTISLNGRQEVAQSGAAAYDAWLAGSTGS